jgi:site-specific recombinase
MLYATLRYSTLLEQRRVASSSVEQRRAASSSVEQRRAASSNVKQRRAASTSVDQRQTASSSVEQRIMFNICENELKTLRKPETSNGSSKKESFVHPEFAKNFFFLLKKH